MWLDFLDNSTFTLNSFGTILIPGIPLPDDAAPASMAKLSLHNITAGVLFSSVKIASYTRYLVQDPQSPTANMAASTSLIHSRKRDLSSVSEISRLGIKAKRLNSNLGAFFYQSLLDCCLHWR